MSTNNIFSSIIICKLHNLLLLLKGTTLNALSFKPLNITSNLHIICNALETLSSRESCEREIDRLHQEVKDRETQLSTEKLKFDYEREELQKQLNEQKQLVTAAKTDVSKARAEMDRAMEEQEEEKNRLVKEMAVLRDETVRHLEVTSAIPITNLNAVYTFPTPTPPSHST